MLKKITAGLITALAVMVAGLALTTAPAAASYTSCPTGTACVYTGEFGQGSQGVIPWSGFSPAGSCHDLVSPFTNNVNSAHVGYGNNHGLRLWTGSGCTGSSWTVNPNNDADWAPSSSWGDNFESFQIT